MPTLADALRGKALSGPGLPESARPPRVSKEFVWHRPWPDHWERALRMVSEKSDVHGWLYGTWESGEEWVPGQRFVLYEMLHPRWVSFDLMEEYEGPHPRSEGHYCSTKVPKQFQCHCKTKLEKWRDGPCELITATQYRIYRETGYVPRYLFWIIQGKGGGHKAFFTEQEEDWLTATGVSLKIPALGALPYADFDERVLSHIHKMNALRKYGNDIVKYRRAMGPEHEAEIQKRLRDFRESVVHWFDQQMNEECELFVDAARKGELDDQPKTDIDWVRVEEASTPHYIETGQQLHPSRVPRGANR